VCDLETSRMGAPYIYDISRLRVKCETCFFFHSRTVHLDIIKIVYLPTDLQ